VTETQAPFLTAWFQIMDSDQPSKILDLISEDFTFSILFSTGGEQATDFSGGRAVLEDYLRQREKGTRTHHRIMASSSGREELFLGEVRRAGGPEATFVAAGQINENGLLERFLVGRSPAVLFHSGGC
jgi:ketosteroid isomerase-like protein